jgi:hypothetical protein
MVVEIAFSDPKTSPRCLGELFLDGCVQRVARQRHPVERLVRAYLDLRLVISPQMHVRQVFDLLDLVFL